MPFAVAVTWSKTGVIMILLSQFLLLWSHIFLLPVFCFLYYKDIYRPVDGRLSSSDRNHANRLIL